MKFVLPALGVLFVGLKLTGYIDWSWWWVTAPFWGGAALGIVLIVMGVVLVAITEASKGEKNRW